LERAIHPTLPEQHGLGRQHAGRFYGRYTIGIYHLNEYFDLEDRAEWFDDPQGRRTGVRANYEEVTLGLNCHTCKYLDIRLEIRSDFASAPAFGANGEYR
jgi:hypothetical protein